VAYYWCSFGNTEENSAAWLAGQLLTHSHGGHSNRGHQQQQDRLKTHPQPRTDTTTTHDPAVKESYKARVIVVVVDNEAFLCFASCAILLLFSFLSCGSALVCLRLSLHSASIPTDHMHFEFFLIFRRRSLASLASMAR
jgi:hypothetical protein